MEFTIRNASPDDLEEILKIYASARIFMKENGNGDQWGDSYPDPTLVERDLDKTYLCITETGAIACVFYFAIEEDADYRHIEGRWLDPGIGGVVHRVASAQTVKGAAGFSLAWAFSRSGNLRIDTYKDNLPMQKLLDKCGFIYCGTIFREGMEWMAYQKIR